jgi:hypothetical protein
MAGEEKFLGCWHMLSFITAAISVGPAQNGENLYFFKNPFVDGD